MLQQFRIQLLAMIRKARDTENYMSLVGIDESDYEKEENPVPVTFGTLKEIFEEALVNLEVESKHVHDFKTENGMCSGCSADGNA